ncbi:uncharacterized protein LOC113512413 isoform X2 [Galleria mellonella]|uniref:Uncharacterized protein LOC113512413 isoform X2 n=1 Tax=Galleria mellonella TaxID=7137 RepID=A0A6J1WEH6_GALME|nr:uncharacterized protein LOC113512413 isoform X2 [Galleria mellonella]
MLRTCCLMLCLVAGSRQLSISTFVVPNAVETGQNAELQCQFSLDASDTIAPYVKWWWTPLYVDEEERDKKQLYQRLESDVSILHSNIEHLGNDTILLTDMKYTDSGNYECEVFGITEIRMHKELIVYLNGSGPQLNISEVADGPDDDSEEDILLECEAEGVSPQPELSLTVNGKEVDNLTTHVINTSNGLYNISANVTISKEEVDGAEVRCELFYENPDVTHPPYVDIELYDPSGSDSNGLRTSWMVIVMVTIPIYLRVLL